MASLTWTHLDEFWDDLRALPDNLGTEGAALAEQSAVAAAAAIRAAYPRRTGRLADSVQVQPERRAYGARVRVVNTAPYARVFEFGRQTGIRGSTPPRPTFIPILGRYQRDLVVDLMALLERHGLRVSGDAG